MRLHCASGSLMAYPAGILSHQSSRACGPPCPRRASRSSCPHRRATMASSQQCKIAGLGRTLDPPGRLGSRMQGHLVSEVRDHEGLGREGTFQPSESSPRWCFPRLRRSATHHPIKMAAARNQLAPRQGRQMEGGGEGRKGESRAEQLPMRTWPAFRRCQCQCLGRCRLHHRLSHSTRLLAVGSVWGAAGSTSASPGLHFRRSLI